MIHPTSHVSAGARKHRVLVIDDHHFFRQTLVDWIASHERLECCAQADCLTAAHQAVYANSPDLILLDLGIGSTSGFDFLHWMPRMLKPLPVIVLSQHEEQEYASSALAAGAHGYVCKTTAPEELELAIDAVLEGKCYVSRRGAFRRA